VQHTKTVRHRTEVERYRQNAQLSIYSLQPQEKDEETEEDCQSDVRLNAEARNNSIVCGTLSRCLLVCLSVCLSVCVYVRL